MIAGMKVCIAEKPSVAREIASVLGATLKRDGYFEGNGYQVTWTFGHLCTLKEPHDYNVLWKSWSMLSLPLIPERFGIKLIDNDSYKRQFEVIASLVSQAELVINCGDAGQEGELIQRWVLQKAGVRCPVKRLWISSLTEDSIRDGFNALRDSSEFDRLYQAGLSRAIGDWLLGMNATRLYTLKYSAARQQVLSIGRVQTPTLSLIVKRQQEIEGFVPQPYWELKTMYRGVLFTSLKGKFASSEQGKELFEQIRDKDFVIEDISRKKAKEYAPRLFDLTSLQVECNRKYAMSAEDTLNIVQGLYERKLVTYPRVDTAFLSDDIYPKVPSILSGLKPYSEFTAALQGKKLPKSKRVFDNSKVTDHHAIIPTGVTPQGLAPEHMKVYDLIARRFIAAFWPDCEVSATSVSASAGTVPFKANGKVILTPGWRTVFADDKADDSVSADEPQHQEAKDGAILPDFVKGESGPHEPVLKETWTSPPKPYTEATLLRAMETAGKFVDDDELRDALKDNGIGRPSTRAAIIETLFRRNYIRKERKNLFPTDTGRELISLIGEELLKSAELTGMWEKKLRQMEKGQYDARHFIAELKMMVTGIVNNVLREGNPLPVHSSVACPVCGKGHIMRGKTAFGCSEYKSGCGFRLPYGEYDRSMSDAALERVVRSEGQNVSHQP